MPRKHRKTGKPRTGRPYDGPALAARVDWADWVEKYAQVEKQQGSKEPYRRILFDLIEMVDEEQLLQMVGKADIHKLTKDPEQTKAALRELTKAELLDFLREQVDWQNVLTKLYNDQTLFARIKKNFKKKRLKARRELAMMKELAKERAKRYPGRTKLRPDDELERDYQQMWAEFFRRVVKKLRRRWQRAAV